MIAVNWAAPAAAAGALLAFAAWALPADRMGVRAAWVAAAAALAAAIFVTLEPRCLGGPYAMMDPGVRAIWFDHVSEMQSIWKVAPNSPAMAAAVVAFPLVSLAATVLLACEEDLRRDPRFLIVACVLVVACALTATVVKMCMYAMWFGMPLVAAACLRLFARLRIANLALRTVLTLLLTPMLLSAGAIALAEAAGAPEVVMHDSRVLGGCFKTANYAPLAALPPGVVATDIDYGSFVLALTPHAVIAAPYHRLGDAIIAGYRIFTLPPDAARGVLEKFGATYVVTCGESAPPGMSAAERAASLWGRLRAGAAPDWLQPVPAMAGDAFKVYRIVGTPR
jgi:hypothetical protein